MPSTCKPESWFGRKKSKSARSLPRPFAGSKKVPATLRLLLALGASSLIGCAGESRYEDPEAVETIDDRFGQTDLHLIVSKMVDSFMGTQVWPEAKPVMLMGAVQNRTRQHLDTKNISDSIRTALIQSGRFRFVAGDQGKGEISEETVYQASGAVDPDTAVELGKQLGASYVMFGRFTEIKKETERVRSRFMKFTLNVVDVENRVLLWSEEQKISKVTEKAFLGW
ncbi:MAG: penicillin-binding protein activator LpoB [Planctomycetota bacterium]|nr:MAG: penicillin-binding protein activator LpoB [Planctomycetota bacterium]